jgi:hypothetical protein
MQYSICITVRTAGRLNADVIGRAIVSFQSAYKRAQLRNCYFFTLLLDVFHNPACVTAALTAEETTFALISLPHSHTGCLEDCVDMDLTTKWATSHKRRTSCSGGLLFAKHY